MVVTIVAVVFLLFSLFAPARADRPVCLHRRHGDRPRPPRGPRGHGRAGPGGIVRTAAAGTATAGGNKGVRAYMGKGGGKGGDYPLAEQKNQMTPAKSVSDQHPPPGVLHCFVITLTPP